MTHDDYDDLDETADAVDDEAEKEADPESEADEASGAEAASGEAAGGEGPISRKDIDEAESLTVSSKEALRRQLEEEMERFLAKGGKIQEIPPDASADPQRKSDGDHQQAP